MHEITFPKVVRSRNDPSKRVLLVDLRGAGATGDDENAAFVDGAEAFQPLGFAARPVLSEELEALAFSDGDEDLVLCLVDKSQAPLDLEEGESRVYGAKEVTAMLAIRANGDVRIIPKAGQKVFIGASTGTEPLALGQTLTSFLSSLRTWLGAHTHAGVTTGAGVSGVPATAGALPTLPTITTANVEGK